MRIELRRAAVGSGLSADVPPLDLLLDSVDSASPGTPIALAVETAERPQLVSLLLGGRLRPSSGTVLVDGVDDGDALRRRTALVDTPFTSEPSPGVRLSTVVAEELAFASRPAGRHAVAAVLAEHGLADHARVPLRALGAADRIRLLAELALQRDGVDALVVTSPERHGGEAAAWFGALARVAERGILVAIVTDAATASALIALGARDGAVPEDADPVPDDAAATEATSDDAPTDPETPKRPGGPGNDSVTGAIAGAMTATREDSTP